MTSTPRLRQVALVARDLDAAVRDARERLGLGEPFEDPGVALFGLRNAVFTVGDCFLEIVSPAREDTAAGRHLDRLGGDGGYMAIFQVEDFAAARARVERVGIRIAWQIELGDISAMHLHPADVPGAIVSLDEPRPPESWRWGGPAWCGTVPPHARGGFRHVSVAVPVPVTALQRWREVLGEDPPGVEFVEGDRGIVALTIEREGPEGTYDVCGVRVTTVNPSGETDTR